jgi:hypothetical protein
MNTSPDKKMFTRQHFQFLAQAVSAMEIDYNTKLLVASGLADRLQSDNYAFNRLKFIDVCMDTDHGKAEHNGEVP